MGQPITVKKARYYPYTDLFPGSDDAGLKADLQKRQSYVSSKLLRLDWTSGVYATILGRTVLFIIDRRTVQPGTPEWRFIGEIIGHLVKCSPGLSSQGRTALASLTAVVFSTSPERAYADVKPNCFVYDVDEFRREDGSFISPAYAASNIVHDANHIWMYDKGQDYSGNAAEIICWQLQIDNEAAIGLAAHEVQFLKGLVAKPETVAKRIEQDPLKPAPKLACSALGKCSAGAQA